MCLNFIKWRRDEFYMQELLYISYKITHIGMNVFCANNIKLGILISNDNKQIIGDAKS